MPYHDEEALPGGCGKSHGPDDCETCWLAFTAHLDAQGRDIDEENAR